MLGLILFIIAYVLYFPLTLINFCLVRNKGYFRDSALTLDKLANRELHPLEQSLNQRKWLSFWKHRINNIRGIRA